MDVREVLDRLKDHRQHQGEQKWEARCPAHEDRRFSLGVSVGGDGRVLLFCQAGCSTEEVVAKLGLKMADLFQPEERPAGRRVVATYDYRDEAGVLLFQVLRYEPKDFRQRRPKCVNPRQDVYDDWTWNVRDTRTVVYRYPDLLARGADETVYVVEGEKDADALWSRGLPATCNPMGAGKWWKAHSDCLANRRVVIIPDNDDAGREHAEKVRKSLEGKAASAVVIPLAGLAPKGDVSDWLAAGHTAEELAALAAPAAPEGPFPAPVNVADLTRTESTQQWIWKGILARGEVTLFSALWKSGKTTLLAHLLRAMHAGGEFCGSPVARSSVLYVTEENENRWAERRDELGLKGELDFLIRPFRNKPDVARWEAFVVYVSRLVERSGYDVVVFDTLANLWPVKDENDASGMTAALMPLHEIVKGKACLLLVHHNRKSDGMEATASRGSGVLTAWVDTIIEFRRCNAGDRKDYTRLLSGYGRHDETPKELVIELTPLGYVSKGGDREALRRDADADVIQGLLPSEPPGFTADEVLAAWPAGETPNRSRFVAALKAGAEASRWAREGEGKKGSPYTYWLPMEET